MLSVYPSDLNALFKGWLMAKQKDKICWTKSYRVKENYTDEQCVGIAKENAEKCFGIDPNFIKSLKEKGIDDYSCENMFVPIYLLDFTANREDINEEIVGVDRGTYLIGNVKRNYNERFQYPLFYGYDKTLEPTIFQGGESERLTEIKNEMDLPYPLYNPEKTCHFRNEVEQSALVYANRNTKKRISYNSVSFWNNSNISFIPIVLIRCIFNDKEYVCMVNKHNGKCFWDGYPISKKLKKSSKIFASASLIFKILDIAAMLFSVYLLVGFFIDDIWDGVIVTVLAVPLQVFILVIMRNAELFEVKSDYYLDKFLRYKYKSFISLLIGNTIFLALNALIPYVLYMLPIWLQ